MSTDGLLQEDGKLDTEAVATYEKWENYTGTYVQVSRDDLIEKIINACDYCYFQAPQWNQVLKSRGLRDNGAGYGDWAGHQ